MILKKTITTELDFNLSILPVDKKTGKIVAPSRQDLDFLVMAHSVNTRYQMGEAILEAIEEANKDKE